MPGTLALVLTGGGARAAYQIGFLRCLARKLPELRLSVITGVSAGAINATYLAARPGSLADAVESLYEMWSGLTPERVFRVDSLSVLQSALRWGFRLVSGGSSSAPRVRGLLDTQPLRELLSAGLEIEAGRILGIDRNLEENRLQAFALTTLSYSTGQTVTWVQGCGLEAWERPNRVGMKTRITVEHVMASSALPFLFPAVELAGGWYGDGGIRLASPLAPAIHLGADRILAVSTRYPRSRGEANEPVVTGYPPPAQVAGELLNAVFLDALDQDAQRLERINSLVEKLPPEDRGRLRPIEMLVLRPSVDLGRLAAEFEPQLPGTLRFLTRGLGTRETTSPDLLSMLLFQPDYLSRLIEIGERDAEARAVEILALVRRS